MNGWLRDFFKNNAYALLMGIISLVVMWTMTRMTVNSMAEQLKEITPKVRVLEIASATQLVTNNTYEKYISDNNKRLDRIEDKLDDLLSLSRRNPR